MAGQPLDRLLSAIDWTADACARAGQVMVVLIAAMLFYEVVARYVFLAPTGWAQDIAITAQVWFTYLGMAFVLRHREMIRITAVLSWLGPGGRKLMDAFSLIVIVAFSVMAVYYASSVVADSIRIGRRQPTMLEMPNWISELPVVIGFALLAVQGCAELVRLPFRPAPEFSPGGTGEPAVEEESRP